MELGRHLYGFVQGFLFLCWLQNVNNVLNEVKSPVKTLKSTASTALLTACLLHFLVNVAYFLIVPIEEIKNSGELIAPLFFERLFGARVGRILLLSAVAISAAGSVMVVTFSRVRQFTSFEQTLLNRFAGSHHSRNRTTRLFTVFQHHYVDETFPRTVGRARHSLHSFFARYLYSSRQHLLLHPRCGGLPWQIFALASSLGVIWLRFKRPDLRRPYKAFLPDVWIRIALSIALLIAPFFPRAGLDWMQHLKQVSYGFVGTLM